MKIISSILIYGILIMIGFLSQAQAAKAGGLPLFSSNDMTPYWEADQSSKKANEKFQPAVVPEFRATNQSNNTISEKNFDGKISLVNFFFADCPQFCPLMMRNIQSFLKTNSDAAKGVNLFSFSVMPDKDSPEKLMSYAKGHSIDSKVWNLLTGDEKQIFHIGKDIFRADGSVGSQRNEDTFIHTANIYLVDSQRRIRGIYDTGNAKMMALLAKDLMSLKAEKK